MSNLENANQILFPITIKIRKTIFVKKMSTYVHSKKNY